MKHESMCSIIEWKLSN